MMYELDGGVFENVGRVWRPELGAETKRMVEEYWNDLEREIRKAMK